MTTRLLTIPEVRDELTAVAGDLDRAGMWHEAERIRGLVQQMHRRKPQHMAPYSSQRATPELKREIRLWLYRNPTATYMQAGAAFSVSIGRVSEAVAGWRA